MGKQDRKDRPFFSDKERFAEFINCNIYHGEQIVLPENLELLKRKYPSLAGASGEKERDVVMKDRRRNICYGLEIETEFDYSMPERVMIYDACEYEYQIKEIYKRHTDEENYDSYREKKSRIKEDDFLLPVITAVLYLGEGHWDSCSCLTGMFHMLTKGDMPQEEYLNDYSFPLIEADYVNPEDYRTDLKEFFQAMQCRQDKKRLAELFQSERFQTLSVETVEEIAVHLSMKGLMRKIEKIKTEEGALLCVEQLKSGWKMNGTREDGKGLEKVKKKAKKKKSCR